jgi:hypothetical protein
MVTVCRAKADNSFKYAAVEYYEECYWGITLDSGQISTGLCIGACVGDAAEQCGANDGAWGKCLSEFCL